MQLHAMGENERRHDLLYNMMTNPSCAETAQLARGIVKLIQENSSHPAVEDLVQTSMGEHAIVIRRALIFAALSQEPDFLQYVLDAKNTCSSTVSQLAVVVLPPVIECLLNGTIDLKDFVLQCTHAYTTL